MEYSLSNLYQTIYDYASSRGCSDIFEVKQYYDMTFPQEKYDSYIEMLNNDRYNIITLDTETTGLADDDEILQLSIIDKQGNCLFDDYFKPSHKTEWKKAEAIHHINFEKVKDCELFEKRLNEIQKIINDADLIVGYNVGFDIRNLRRQDVFISYTMPTADVMKMFAPIYAEQRYRSTDKFDFKWQKLITCSSFYFDEDTFDFHNSLDDVRATINCFKAILEKEYEPFKKTIEKVGDWNDVYDFFRSKQKSRELSL